MRRILVKVGFVLLIALTLSSMVSFSPKVTKKIDEAFRLEVVSRMVGTYRGAATTDRVRRQSIGKIKEIIRTYNQSLNGETSDRIADTVHEMSVKYDNLDVDLICATITHESARTWDPQVVSPVGALGLMQIMPGTGRLMSQHANVAWTTAERVLFEPVTNIRLGCRYLSMLIELYSIDGGLAAYNGGAVRAKKWLASGRNDEVLYEETRDYIPAVLKLYDTFRN